MTDCGVREDADDVRSPFDLFVQPFQRIHAVELPLVVDREMPVREDVFGGVREQRGPASPKRARRPIGTFGSCVIAVA